MNETDVKKFYKRYMDAGSRLSTEDVINIYKEMMESDKAFTNDELLEFAKLIIYDSTLNRKVIHKIHKNILKRGASNSKPIPNMITRKLGFDGYDISSEIFTDMSERGVIFDIPMVTKMLGNRRFGYYIQSHEQIDYRCMPNWLLNMMKNGYVLSKSQYVKLNELRIGIPLRYVINNKFICNQNNFELLSFCYLELYIEKDFTNIKKILKKNDIEMTDKFISNFYSGFLTTERFNKKMLGFCLEFIKEFGNREYELKYEHLINFIKLYNEYIFINIYKSNPCEKIYEIIMYHVENIKNIYIDIDIFSCSTNIDILRKLINENVINTKLTGKEERFVSATLMSDTSQFVRCHDDRSDDFCKKLLSFCKESISYFKPKYTEKLFDYACIYQNTLLINYFIKNDKAKITDKKFDIACKSGYSELVDYLLNSCKKIEVTEQNIIDYAFSHNYLTMHQTDKEKIDECKKTIPIINKMISLVKISDNTKLMLMDVDLYEKNKEYEKYYNEINPKLNIPKKKKNDYEDYTQHKTLSNKIFNKFLNEPLEVIASEITQEDVSNKYYMSIIVSNKDYRIANYLGYKYNFKPTFYQVLGCSILRKRIHLLNKYYLHKN